VYPERRKEGAGLDDGAMKADLLALAADLEQR
jgi:hypothetical protein